LRTTNFDPGGFAEYVRVPEINVDRGVFVLPDNMSLEDGTFIEPLACVVRGQRVARIEPGQTVVVIGSGMSGLLHILLAQSLGAGKIIATDVSEYRMEMARKLGADSVISAHDDLPSHILKLNSNRLADRVIVTAGADSALETALKSVGRGGTILFFAPGGPDTRLSVPFNEFWKNCTTLVPTYGASPLDIEVAIELISSQRVPVQEMITHRLGLSEAVQGFKLVTEAKESVKVIIEPHK
jgi:L-iditol 2-dehydrogenase